MQIQQIVITNLEQELNLLQELEPGNSLIFVFSSTQILKTSSVIEEIHKLDPHAEVVGCSTAGEIIANEIKDNSISIMALRFDKVITNIATRTLLNPEQSQQVGEGLAAELLGKGLRHVFVLASGLNLNGSALVQGLKQGLPTGVSITGGLAGDGYDFKETIVFHNSFITEHGVIGVGLYGDSLEVGYGAFGGWDDFGPNRIITKSDGNVLYEMDGISALDLYKKYLGEYAANLPASGLLFPLCLTDQANQRVVRTILAIDEEKKSITFAGEIPQGSHARLMRANLDRLIDGASLAASNCDDKLNKFQPELLILISCVGRRMILGQRSEEELEAVSEVLGQHPTIGFYSYGEISPLHSEVGCNLHNQTMAITALREVS